MRCIKVKLKDAETVKLKLLELGAFNKNYSVIRDVNFVYFPVNKNIKGFNNVNRKLKKKSVKLSFDDLLGTKLTKNELDLVKTSYDIVGNIAILEVDKKLLNKKKIIGEAMLKSNKNLRTVVRRVGGYEGKYRVRNYEFLAGEKNLEVLHKESGIIVKLDLGKMYFSPRLSNERMRIAKQVQDGEKILVMFSGVGIYPLVISKYSRAKEIYGIEVNPDACKYADENVKLNKVKNVNLFCGDVNDVVPELRKKFDRIIMPLPKDSIKFLDLALKYIKKSGFIHLYFFSKEDAVYSIVNFIKSKIKIKVLNVAKTGQPSPRVYRYCLDFMVE